MGSKFLQESGWLYFGRKWEIFSQRSAYSAGTRSRVPVLDSQYRLKQSKNQSRQQALISLVLGWEEPDRLMELLWPARLANH